MTHTELKIMFEKCEDEYLKFDRIPKEQRRHSRPDLCAMLYMHEKFGGHPGRDYDRDAICHASHDEICLDWEGDKITATQEDALYLTRCGVRFEDDGTFRMFV